MRPGPRKSCLLSCVLHSQDAHATNVEILILYIHDTTEYTMMHATIQSVSAVHDATSYGCRISPWNTPMERFQHFPREGRKRKAKKG